MRPLAELVSTGAELLNGKTLNRHAGALGEQLLRLGIDLVRDTTVPDDVDLIADAVASALRRVDLVFVSGGLGPTLDDVTRDALARVLKRGIHRDEPSMENLRATYTRMGREVTPLSERQALVLDGAAVLPNPVGMAPGERIDIEGKALFVLPGPPREFDAVLTRHILPWLKENVRSAVPFVEKIFLVCGVGESDIASRLEQDGWPPSGVELAYCASPGRIEVRVRAAPVNRALLEEAAARIRQTLGENIFAEERIGMEDVVGRLLRDRGLTLATAESCTGGLIGQRLTSIAGSSEYYCGGVIAYSNEAKARDLDVPRDILSGFGAVSEETARAMAEGVRRRWGADIGMSVTGIAGPGGGTPQKPVGLMFLGIADAHGVLVHRRQIPGNRAWIREWAAQLALDLLRRRLQGLT